MCDASLRGRAAFSNVCPRLRYICQPPNMEMLVMMLHQGWAAFRNVLLQDGAISKNFFQLDSWLNFGSVTVSNSRTNSATGNISVRGWSTR